MFPLLIKTCTHPKSVRAPKYSTCLWVLLLSSKPLNTQSEDGFRSGFSSPDFVSSFLTDGNLWTSYLCPTAYFHTSVTCFVRILKHRCCIWLLRHVLSSWMHCKALTVRSNACIRRDVIRMTHMSHEHNAHNVYATVNQSHWTTWNIQFEWDWRNVHLFPSHEARQCDLWAETLAVWEQMLCRSQVWTLLEIFEGKEANCPNKETSRTHRCFSLIIADSHSGISTCKVTRTRNTSHWVHTPINSHLGRIHECLKAL